MAHSQLFVRKNYFAFAQLAHSLKLNEMIMGVKMFVLVQCSIKPWGFDTVTVR